MRTLSHIPLSDIVYYHIGGNAEHLIEVSNKDELLEAITKVIQEKTHPVHILGLGANLLIPDGGLDGVVIFLQSGNDNFTLVNEGKIAAFAGATFDSLIKYAYSQDLVGLGWAGGLPSSVGGAIRGNAGCFGSETKNHIVSVDVVDMTDPTLKIQTISHDDCAFGYRDSMFKHNPNLVIISAVFQLENGLMEQLARDEAVYHSNIAYRETHHPMDYPSCGSIFKNIVGKDKVEKMLGIWPDMKEKVEYVWHGKVSMAYVIGKLGFSGYRVGNAQVSEKHNNYISNLGHAKSNEVNEIITAIKETFAAKFGFEPELEVERI